MTMKRDCLIVIGGLIPVLAIPLLPQQLWVCAFLLLLVVAIAVSAVLIAGVGEMERAREKRAEREGSRLPGTPGEFWVGNQCFRNQ
jgi:hypothetical protein